MPFFIDFGSKYAFATFKLNCAIFHLDFAIFHWFRLKTLRLPHIIWIMFFFSFKLYYLCFQFFTEGLFLAHLRLKFVPTKHSKDLINLSCFSSSQALTMNPASNLLSCGREDSSIMLNLFKLYPHPALWSWIHRDVNCATVGFGITRISLDPLDFQSF